MGIREESLAEALLGRVEGGASKASARASSRVPVEKRLWGQIHNEKGSWLRVEMMNDLYLKGPDFTLRPIHI